MQPDALGALLGSLGGLRALEVAQLAQLQEVHMDAIGRWAGGGATGGEQGRRGAGQGLQWGGDRPTHHPVSTHCLSILCPTPAHPALH